MGTRPVYTRPSFDSGRECYARREFRSGGRVFPVGSHFPWRQLAVNLRRVKQMYDAGKLSHEPVPGFENTQPQPYQPEEAPQEATESISEALSEDPGVHSDTSEGAEENTLPEAPLDLPEVTESMSMSDLRAIAESEGAPKKLSKAEQVAAILENRQG